MNKPPPPCPVFQTHDPVSNLTGANLTGADLTDASSSLDPPTREWKVGERAYWRRDDQRWEAGVVVDVLPPVPGRQSWEFDAVERLMIQTDYRFSWRLVQSSSVRREEELVRVLRSEVEPEVLRPEAQAQVAPSPDAIDGLSPEECHARWRVNAAAIECGDGLPYALTPAQVTEAKLQDASRQRRQVDLVCLLISRSAERERNRVRVDLEFDPWD